MSEKHLIVTVGLPGTGKRGWARSTGLPVVSAASVRQNLQRQDVINLREASVWAVCKIAIRSLFEDGAETVVIHATNLTAWQRDDWRSRDWARRFVVFETDPAEIVARLVAQHASQSHIDAIQRAGDRYEPIDSRELFEGEMTMPAASADMFLPVAQPAIDIAGIRRQAVIDFHQRVNALAADRHQAGRYPSAMRQVLAAEGIDPETLEAAT